MHRLFWASLYTNDILNHPVNLQKSTWYSLTLIEWYYFTLAVIKLFCLVYSSQFLVDLVERFCG